MTWSRVTCKHGVYAQKRRNRCARYNRLKQFCDESTHVSLVTWLLVSRFSSHVPSGARKLRIKTKAQSIGQSLSMSHHQIITGLAPILEKQAMDSWNSYSLHSVEVQASSEEILSYNQTNDSPSSKSCPTVIIFNTQNFGPFRCLPCPAPPPKLHFSTFWRSLTRRLYFKRVAEMKQAARDSRTSLRITMD
jgi:hypothetical protein